MRIVPDTRRGALIRFAFGAVVVIAFTAATTAVAGLLQFKQFANDLSLTPAIKHAEVTIPDPGNPQTILVIGSDHRAGEPFTAANTDTMMLVRLDPSSSTINVISVPRDLKVEIPSGGGVHEAKLNSAYSVGGPNLLVDVLKRQLFPGLQISHIVDVNFGGFEALVDAIGCVYTDVDHRYYNNTAVTDYSSIDIQPGYQRLCGPAALSFARFRHSDTDIVRNARQQDFIRWAKDQYGVSRLFANRDSLLRTFGAHTETDQNLHTTDGLINLFNLVLNMAGHSIKQVAFPAILWQCAPAAANGVQPPCYVTADPAAEQGAFRQFMTPIQAASTAAGSGGGKARGTSALAPKLADLTADPADGSRQATTLGKVGMPVYYPRLLATGSSYCMSATGNCPVQIPSPGSYPRAYQIYDQSGNAYIAYRMTLEVNPALGRYYGVQGTTWQSPPILNNPSETRIVAGKQLLLYFNGHKLSLVGWRTPQAVYWISNTLTDDLSSAQMVGIAASLTKAQ